MRKERVSETILKETRSKGKKSSSFFATKFGIIEAYKTLRTNLQFMMKNDRCNVVLITSTLPKDGKSTVVANLGVAFSQTNMRVLIVDCDMRKPRISKFFNVAAAPGLSNYLVKLSGIDKIIQKTSHANLHVVTSGTLPPNPAELLSSSEMLAFIESVRDHYDLVLLDAPPLSLVSDACVITKYSDGVLLIIKHAFTTFSMVDRSLKSLALVNAKVWGIVMNAVNFKKVYGKKDGYYSHYGYSYGKNGYGDPFLYGAELNINTPSNVDSDTDPLVNKSDSTGTPFAVSRIDTKHRSNKSHSSVIDKFTKGK